MDTVRIKTEPVDDYYDSYNNNSLDQTPGSSSSSSGKLGKRTKPTWSLRELELSDDEGGRQSSNSSEYEPSGSSEEEISESEEDSDTANQASSSGIKKRRLSNTSKKVYGGGNKKLQKSYPTNFFSRLTSTSSSSNSSTTSTSAPKQQNNSPSFLQFKLQNGSRRKQQFQTATTFPQQASIQSIAHAITINNNVVDGQRKKPAPDLTPIKSSSVVQFHTTPKPELFLMEKIDQILTLNTTITNDIDNYTKCLVIFDQIFKRLRSHPPSDTKKLVTLQLSSLLEIIKQRKEEGNSKVIQEKMLQITNKIHSFLRVWPTPESIRVKPSHTKIINGGNNNANPVIKQYQPRFALKVMEPRFATNLSSPQLPAATLSRLGTEIRQVPQLTPVQGLVTQRYMAVNSLNRPSNGMPLQKTPVAMLPKILPKIQVNPTASAQPPTLISLDDDNDDGDGVESFSPLKIQNIKTVLPTSGANLTKTTRTNSLNLNRSVAKPATQCHNENFKLKQGNNAMHLSLNNYVATDVDSDKAVEIVAAEQADCIPWMGIRDAELTEEGDDGIEVLDETSIAAAAPIFVRGKYPPNVPIFLEKQLPVSEEEQNGQLDQLIPPNETFAIGAEDLLNISSDKLLAVNNQETHEFSNLLKQLANQSHHNAQQGFPITTMNSNLLWQGQVISHAAPRRKLGSKRSSTQPDDEVILLSDSDEETQKNSSGGNILTAQSDYMVTAVHDYPELNSSVQTTNFVNDSEQMSEECVLGI